MPAVKSSLPFLTCSGLAPPVMMTTVDVSMTKRAMRPTTPARNPKKVATKLSVW